MSHLATRLGLLFVVEVEISFGNVADCFPTRNPLLPEIAQQVGHRGVANLSGRAEWQSADRPQLLFELAGRMGLDRQVSRIMGPGSDLVDQHFAGVRQEKLDADQAHQLKRSGDCMGNFQRLLGG